MSPADLLIMIEVLSEEVDAQGFPQTASALRDLLDVHSDTESYCFMGCDSNITVDNRHTRYN